MWRDYSVSFIRKNKASSASIIIAALIATFFLSLLCSVFYNIWLYDVDEIILNDGDWQGRICVEVGSEELSFINNMPNVEKVVVNEELGETDIYFKNPRKIYRDMGLIADRLGFEKEQITYNYELLAMYFIRIPEDTAPRLLLPFYCVLILAAAVSLIMVIYNSFAVSMNQRVMQLGILSSIGATPGQIRTFLVQEAAALCILPIPVGTLLGAAGGFGVIRMMDLLAVDMAGRREVHFQYHPYVFAITVLSAFITVLVSAYIPAFKLAKLTPLEAMRGSGEAILTKRKRSHTLLLILGIEGELACSSLKAQKKSLRTSALSLTLSFLGFTIMLCFFKLSDISTNYTYFARFKDAWDVMATVKNVKIEEFDLIDELKVAETGNGAESCVIYQKAQAVSYIDESRISEEVKALGGLGGLVGMDEVTEAELPDGADNSESIDGATLYCIQTPIIIMDDEGFTEYCQQAGIRLEGKKDGAVPELNGVIIINRIWDSINSNFRYREYVPFVKEGQEPAVLQGKIEVPVLGYTCKEPILREEYDDYALVHIMPLSLWKKVLAQAAESGITINVEPDVYVRIIEKNVADTEQSLVSIISSKYEVETENRIQEKITNDRLILGYKLIAGGFCVLLAIIGIANVFAYTMGFLRLRRREFARYESVGMTPSGMKKMFLIEILMIAGRPVLITLPFTVVLVEIMIKASYLDSAEFWMQAPYIPVFIFIATIFCLVMLAYYIGGKRILRSNLIETLRDMTD